jgi:hypothetical protein
MDGSSFCVLPVLVEFEPPLFETLICANKYEAGTSAKNSLGLHIRIRIHSRPRHPYQLDPFMRRHWQVRASGAAGGALALTLTPVFFSPACAARIASHTARSCDSMYGQNLSR